MQVSGVVIVGLFRAPVACWVPSRHSLCGSPMSGLRDSVLWDFFFAFSMKEVVFMVAGLAAVA